MLCLAVHIPPVHAGNVLFILCCWHIWTHRNSIIHQTNPVPFNHKTVSTSILSRALEWEYLIQSSAPHRRTPHPPWPSLSGRLHRPDVCFKLHIDGSGSSVSSEACAGGIVRDDKENWVTGFSCKLGLISRFAAEIWALYHGLQQLLKQRNLAPVFFFFVFDRQIFFY